MNITYIFYRMLPHLDTFCSHLTNCCPGRGLLAQGYDPASNAYHNKMQPYIAYWGAAWTLFFIFVNGFAVFWNFTAAGFLTACTYLSCLYWHVDARRSIVSVLVDINIPIFIVLYLGYKIVKKTSIWKPLEMDFVTVSMT